MSMTAVYRSFFQNKIRPQFCRLSRGCASSMDKLDVSHREAVLRTLGSRSELIKPNLARTYIPALTFEAFGNLGETVQPWSLMKLFDTSFFLDVFPMFDNNFTREKYMIYTLGCRIDIDQSFYDLKTPKFPLVIDQSWLYLRNTSRRTQFVLRHPEHNTPYAVKSDVDVNVDPKTRRPAPFPTWLKEKLCVPAEGPKLEYAIPEQPKDVVVSNQRVCYSDLDENWHVNYSSYARYCFDAFAENASSRKYARDVTSLLKNGLKSFQILFVNETLLGDVVNIESWQDINNENMFHFIVKKGDEVRVRLTYEFFDKLPNNYTNIHNKL